MTTLKDALDRVWQDHRPRLESASLALRDMDADALLDIVRVVLLACVGSRLIIDNRVEPGALFLRHRDSGVSTQAHLAPASAAMPFSG